MRARCRSHAIGRVRSSRRSYPSTPCRIEGFDEAIVSLYAKGLTTGEIRAHLAEIYDVEVSRDLISQVTDRVAEELAAWRPARSTPLEFYR